MSIVKSYWFWLVIIGLIIIIIAALLTSGFQQDNSWIWWIFVLGITLLALGIIFGLVTWNSKIAQGELEECEIYDGNLTKKDNDSLNKKTNLNTEISGEPNVERQTRVVTPAVPLPMPSAPSSPVTSPIRSPTKVTINFPQAQKGFLSSTDSLATLAPSP